jgi:hypothetical protein
VAALLRRRVALLPFAVALAMAALPASVLAGGREVLADYEDNGQIDGCYTLAEFQEALRLIRPDQRQYGAAVDVIRQAELTNIRRPGQPCGATATTPAADPGGADDGGGGAPTALIVVGVVGGVAVLGGIGWAVSRRGRGPEAPPSDDAPAGEG